MLTKRTKSKYSSEIVNLKAKKYQKDLELEIALKRLKDKDLKNREDLEEVQKIRICI